MGEDGGPRHLQSNRQSLSLATNFKTAKEVGLTISQRGAAASGQDEEMTKPGGVGVNGYGNQKPRPDPLSGGTIADLSIAGDREIKKDFCCDSLMLRPVQSKIQWL